MFVCSQSVDESDAVYGFAEGSLCVESGFDVWKQILLFGRMGCSNVGCCGCGRFEPWVLERLLGSQPFGRVNGEELIDEIFGRLRDVFPVLGGLESVICIDDGLHLFHGGIAIERGISAEEEVCNDTNGPHIDGFTVTSLLKDLRSHVSRCTAGGGENGDLFVIHYTGETEIGNQKIALLGLVPEEKILGLKISVYDALIVQIDNRLGDGAYDMRGILLKIAPSLADSIEQLSSNTQISDEVKIVHGLEIVDQGDDGSMALRDALESSDFVTDHVLASLHELFRDDLAGVVLTRFDVDGFLDDGIGALSEGATGLVGTRHGLGLCGCHGMRKRELSGGDDVRESWELT